MEELLGVKLLKCPDATKTLTPCILFSGDRDLGIISVSCIPYYLHNKTLDPKSRANSCVFHRTGDRAYHVTYQATMLLKDNIEYRAGYSSEMSEIYTTPSGLKAGIFFIGSDYSAVIYHDNICYTFEMCAKSSSSEFALNSSEKKYSKKEQLIDFKAFLDTLS